MNIRKSTVAVATIAAFSALATAAYAGGGVTNLPAGTLTTSFNGATTTGLTQVTTTTVNNVVGLSSGSAAVFEADVTETVYKNAGGYLTFTYLVNQVSDTVSHGVNDAIGLLTASNFGNWVTKVGQQGPVIPAAGISTEAANDGFGDINFTLSGMDVGVSSYLLYISTSSKNYGIGNIALQDGGNVNVAGYAPAAPEPGTIAAFAITGLGIMLMMLSARRKQTLNQLT